MSTPMTLNGWMISSALLNRPDRPYALSVSVNLAAQATTPEDLATADRPVLEAAPGYEAGPTEAIDVDGARVAVHRYRWSRDGDGPVQQARFYAARDGIGYLLTASEAPPPEHERELAALVAGLRLELRSPVDFAEEELAAIAQLAGIPAFPGLEGRDPAPEPVLMAARRALVARGMLRALGPGRIGLEPSAGALVQAVLTAQAMIATERRTRDGAVSQLLHLGPETSVRQYAVAPGVQRLEPFAATVLPEMVAATTGLQDRPIPGSGPVTLSHAAYRALREQGTAPPEANGLGDVARSFSAAVTVRVLRRDGRRVVGGELSWIDAGEAGVWVIEAGPDSVVVTPEDSAGVLRRIAGRMAGGQPAAT